MRQKNSIHTECSTVNSDVHQNKRTALANVTKVVSAVYIICYTPFLVKKKTNKKLISVVSIHFSLVFFFRLILKLLSIKPIYKQMFHMLLCIWHMDFCFNVIYHYEQFSFAGARFLWRYYKFSDSRWNISSCDNGATIS